MNCPLLLLALTLAALSAACGGGDGGPADHPAEFVAVDEVDCGVDAELLEAWPDAEVEPDAELDAEPDDGLEVLVCPACPRCPAEQAPFIYTTAGRLAYYCRACSTEADPCDTNPEHLPAECPGAP